MTDAVDPAFAALLSDPRMALRRPPPGLPVPVIRAAANRFMASAAGPPMHAVQDLLANGPGGPLPMRLYRPSGVSGLPVILFCHGGGFVFGSLDTHDAMCRTLARAAGAAIVAVDYRLAPEHAFPAAYEDCRAALDWIVAEADALDLDGHRVAIAGDSAGGQLAAAVAIAATGRGPRIRHAGLLYPLLDPARASASAQAFAENYMLTESFVEWAWEAYGAGADGDARLDLTRAAVDGFPPTTIVTAAFDPLRDEGEAFAARLRAAGVAVETRRYPGMIHGFAGMPQLTPVADAALGFIGGRIAAAFAA